MWHLRALLALFLTALACLALAVPALAREAGESHQFAGSITSEVSSVGVGKQEFTFAAMQINCKGAKAFKTLHKVIFPTSTIVATIKLIKCKSEAVHIGTLTIP